MTSKQRWKRSFPPAAAQWAKLQPRRSAALVCSKLFTREIPKETLLSFKTGDDGVRSHRARSTTRFCLRRMPKSIALDYWLIAAQSQRDFFSEAIRISSEQFNASCFEPHLRLIVTLEL